MMGLALLTAGIISFISCALLIGVKLPRSFYDSDTKSIQKSHASDQIPRIGGLAVLCGFLLACWLFAGIPELLLLTPLAFISGFIEDLTKKVSPFYRLIFSFIAALLSCLLLDTGFYRSGWNWLDVEFLASSYVAYFIAIIMAGGVMHSINIIDGYNGLSSGFSLAALGCLYYVASQVGDGELALITALLAAAVIGTMLFNYPWGKIFLGDGGAYMLGFLLAILSLLLVNRNPSISPWFPLLVMALPVWETLFSMLRRKFLLRAHAMQPDNRHLHNLIARTLGRHCSPEQQVRRSSWAVAPAMWLVALIGMLPALYFWTDTLSLMITASGFISCYSVLYWQLSRHYGPSLRE